MTQITSVTTQATSAPVMTNFHLVTHMRGETMQTRERIKRVIDEASKALAALDRYGEDVYEIGAALSFEKRFADDRSTYTYIVLKAPNGRWYSTGQRLDVAVTWSRLTEFMAEGPHPVEQIWLVSEYVPVYPS